MADLTWVLSSCVLIGAVIAIRAAFGKRMRPGLRYALWGLVLLRLLLPFEIGSSQWSVASMADKLPERELSENIVTVMGGDVPQLAPQVPDPSLPEIEQRELQREYWQKWERDVTQFKIETGGTPVTIRDVLRVIWLAGTAATAIVFLLSNLRFYYSLRKRRKPLETDCPLRVYSVESLSSSCLFGNAIYVAAETTADEARLRHVLAHELSHHRHGDHVWTLLRCVALSLHWYNPLVWWAAALSRQDSELCADAGALKRLGEDERENYGATLIELSARRAPRASLLCTATTMTNGKQSLKERVTMIARRPRMTVAVVIVVVLIAVVAAGCAFTGATAREDDATSDEALEQTDAEVSAPSVQTSDAARLNGGVTLTIPSKYADLLLTDTPQNNENGVLFIVSEKASVEAGVADGHEESWGDGWLFSIARVGEAELNEMLMTDMSGASVFARDDQGCFYLFYTPTDVRFYRSGDQYISDTEGWKQWETLNAWASAVPEAFLTENPSLMPYRRTNSVPDILLARLAYGTAESVMSEPITLRLRPAHGESAVESIGDADARRVGNFRYYMNYLYRDVTFEAAEFPALDADSIELAFRGGDRLIFWENTNYVRWWDSGSGAQQDLRMVYASGETVAGDLMRDWYDEAEFCILGGDYDHQDAIFIPDRGQTYLEAAQEFCERFEAIHLLPSAGSMCKYTFVRPTVEAAEEQTAHFREIGEIDDGTWCFFLTTVFVPENERARNWSFAGNTGDYTGDEPDVPAGAYEYYRCGYVHVVPDGWRCELGGTGW